MSSSPSVVDVVVVGGGVMGAAATWRLARRGRTVVLLERFGGGHTRGASHGASRIYRQTYAAAPYVRLAVEAPPLWLELEAETGAALLTITGGVDHGDPGRTSELARSLAAQGIAYHWLDADEAGDRWPGMRFDGPVLVQPDRSGRIHADQAVAALTAAARGRGARVRRNTLVTAIRVRGDDLVEVETRSGTVLARRAVVTADGVDGEGGAYGLADPCGDIKVGLHGTGSECHPDRRTFRPEPAALQRLQDYVAEWLPGLDHTRPDLISCTQTSTADGGFVLERSGPLVVGAGFSGHGFTFAPAIGRVLADLATGVSDLAGVR